MAVPINSEPTLAPYFDINGNANIGNLKQGTLTESLGAGGFSPPDGNTLVNNLIMTDQPIQFKFEWGVGGIFAHMVNPAFEWKIEVFLEQYGPGEFTLGPTGRLTVPWSTGTFSSTTQVNFPGTGSPNSTTIYVPANSIPEGLYDVVAVIRLHDAPGMGGLPCFVAAFAEFGKIHFYQEH